jgi:hypothetical protein
MADGKKSVLLYCDILHTIEQLDDATAGQLFKHYLRYINDLDPETENVLVKIAFEPIKQNLKRDLKKWEKAQEEKSLNGRMGNLKRYHLDLYELVNSDKMTIEDAETVAKSRKLSLSDNTNGEAIKDVANLAVIDNVTVTDNVTVIDIINNPAKADKPKSFKQYSEEEFKNEVAIYKDLYPSEMLRKFYSYWIEKSPNGKMKFQLNKTWETKLRLSNWASKEFGKQTPTQQHILKPEQNKAPNPLDIFQDRVTDIWSIEQLNGFGYLRLKEIFGYLKESHKQFMNQTEKDAWHLMN